MARLPVTIAHRGTLRRAALIRISIVNWYERRRESNQHKNGVALPRLLTVRHLKLVRRATSGQASDEYHSRTRESSGGQSAPIRRTSVVPAVWWKGDGVRRPHRGETGIAHRPSPGWAAGSGPRD